MLRAVLRGAMIEEYCGQTKQKSTSKASLADNVLSKGGEPLALEGVRGCRSNTIVRSVTGSRSLMYVTNQYIGQCSACKSFFWETPVL